MNEEPTERSVKSESTQCRADIAAFGKWLVLPIVAALLHIGLVLHAAWIETPTVDEMAHIASGCAMARLGRLDVYNRNPPLAKIMISAPLWLDVEVNTPDPPYPLKGWGPWAYGVRFMRANMDGYLRQVFRVRAAVIPFTLLTAAILLMWSDALWGTRPACVVTTLFLLCPNILAHGHMATLDIPCTFGFTMAMFMLWAALRQGGLAWMATAGAALGLAMAIKFSALILVPVALTAIAMRSLTDTNTTRLLAIRMLILRVVTYGVGALLVVNASIGFRDTFSPIRSFAFESSLCRGLQGSLPGWLPVPMPSDYVKGFDDQQAATEQGEFNCYLRGEWSTEGWWHYNLVALMVKTPEPFLPMVLAGFLVFAMSRRPVWEWCVVLLPAAALLVAVSAFGRMNIGLRYLLPAMPFMGLLAGGAVAVCLADFTPGRGAVARVGLRSSFAALPLGVVLFYGVTAVSGHPSHLGYFNLASGGTENGSHWLLDSNTDWGQDLYRVPSAVRPLTGNAPIGLLYFGHADPALYGIHYRLIPPWPVRGVLAVSVNFLNGMRYVVGTSDGGAIEVEPEHVAWLRRFTPVAKLGSIWVFDTRNANDFTPAEKPSSPPQTGETR